MSFYQELRSYTQPADDFENRIGHVSDDYLQMILNKTKINEWDFYALLSDKADSYLEDMAEKSWKLTRQNFGKAIILYTPLYLANYCINECAYCGFNVKNTIKRHQLSLEEVEKEAEAISSTGLRHILILTGESRYHTPFSYIKQCVQVLKKYFTSIAIEIYPLDKEEYRELILDGVDGLTIYQETYSEKVYDEVHLSGPKRNFRYRLEAPERACEAGIRSVNIGALLGLGENWRQDAFFTALHARYLQNKYLDMEVSVSVPRLRPHAGVEFQPKDPVSDKELVKYILALRLFLPRVGITLSTRESEELRNNLLPLGITRMSAGSKTEVGAYSRDEKTEGQFEVADKRDVDEMHEYLLEHGYQPVYKDWDWGALSS